MAEAVESRLVELTPERHRLVIGLAYAAPGNFTGRAIYANTCCLLRREAAQGLARAAELAALCGFRLKVLDAYRPPGPRNACGATCRTRATWRTRKPDPATAGAWRWT